MVLRARGSVVAIVVTAIPGITVAIVPGTIPTAIPAAIAIVPGVVPTAIPRIVPRVVPGIIAQTGTPVGSVAPGMIVPRVVETVVVVETAHATAVAEVVIIVVSPILLSRKKKKKGIYIGAVGIKAVASLKVDDVVTLANGLIAAAETTTTVILVDVAIAADIIGRLFALNGMRPVGHNFVGRLLRNEVEVVVLSGGR